MKGSREELSTVIIILYDYILCNNNVYISIIYTASINSVFKFAISCRRKILFTWLFSHQNLKFFYSFCMCKKNPLYLKLPVELVFKNQQLS